MEIKLSKQCSRIYEVLKDRQWHCPKEWFYADGHCKRITDLKEKGYVIESQVCNCGQHENKVLARRLIAEPGDYVKPEPESDVVREFREELAKRMEMQKPIETLNGQMEMFA